MRFQRISAAVPSCAIRKPMAMEARVDRREVAACCLADPRRSIWIDWVRLAFSQKELDLLSNCPELICGFAKRKMDFQSVLLWTDWKSVLLWTDWKSVLRRNREIISGQFLKWCVQRDAPFGEETSMEATTRKFDLQSAQRPRGRPKKLSASSSHSDL